MPKTNQPILMVLPHQGFDPSEAAVTWKQLKQNGNRLIFATPDGQPAQADPIMVTGEGLDWWGWMPGIRHIKFIGLFLRANKVSRQAYKEMIQDEAYQHPIRYQQIQLDQVDGIVFPGGHDKSIRPYLESKCLQEKIRQCFEGKDKQTHLPVAAICHGVLAVARTQDSRGKSVVYDRKLTALPWSFEKKAWTMSRVFRFWDPDYYRTYLEDKGEAKGYWGVEQEIKRNLKDPAGFLLPDEGKKENRIKNDGLHRDTETDFSPAWVVTDGNLVTARWPGDVHLFASRFAAIIEHDRSTKPQPVVEGG
jgi:putative intracellular protease/amidase